jgi:hypothetical protein
MKKIKTILSLGCFLMTCNILNSQTCNVTISNLTNCQAHGYIQWYDCNNSPCDYQPFTENAGSLASLYTCNTCATVCNVQFVLQNLGGAIPSWPSVDYSSATNSGASPCNPATFSLLLNTASPTTHLDITP